CSARALDQRVERADDICSERHFGSVVLQVAHPGIDPYTAATKNFGRCRKWNERREVGIDRVGVVGAGLMGSGIAEVCARAGVDVIVCEADVKAAETGRQRVETSLARGVNSGKLDDGAQTAALERIGFTTDLGDLADRELVIEAIVESVDEKLDLF